MQKLLIGIVLVLISSQHVQSSIFSFVSDRVEEWKNDFVSFIKKQFFKGLLKGLLGSDYENRQSSDFVSKNTWLIDEVNEVVPDVRLLESPTAWLAVAHLVYTQDGYILTLHRLRPTTDAAMPKGIVLIHHGLLGSSADWMLREPEKSLPYLLSNAGYDVWLANSRGNYYSRTHLFRKPDSIDYWDFSWQDIGERDLPAIFGYIITITASPNGIIFVGHGMGATVLLVLLSVKPEYNQYVRLAVLLGPLAFMGHTRGPLNDLAYGNLDDSLFTGKELFPLKQVPDRLSKSYCPQYETICKNTLFFFAGGILQKKDTDENFIVRLLNHVPAGASEKTIKHYIQLVLNKKFHKYDGVEDVFPLQNIKAPVAIMSSTDDWLSDVLDNNDLYTALPNAINHIVIEGKGVSHTEFVWGLNVDTVIFSKVIALITNSSNINEAT